MPYKDEDRYALLKNTDGTIDAMPFINLPQNPSDKFEYWNTEYSRLDKLSMKYYGNPFYDYLILYGNRIYLNEFDIPDGALIRIPFPFGKVKADYVAALTAFKK